MARLRIDTFIVTSCDEAYFPLAKGLFLSLIDKLSVESGIGLAFVDAGCSDNSVMWLAERSIEVVRLDEMSPGVLADASLGYQRAQMARAYLPKLFQGVEAFIWMDADTWAQSPEALEQIRAVIRRTPREIVVAPECHYSYSGVHDSQEQRETELYSYYAPAFGDVIAKRMCKRLVLNSGVVGLAGSHRIWGEWSRELERMHERCSFFSLPEASRHMLDQTALNVVLEREGHHVVPLDPICNYLSLWRMPVRDGSGLVRVSLPPYTPIAVVHLAGGWKHFGKSYMKGGLLYRSGEYLGEAEREALLLERKDGGFR